MVCVGLVCRVSFALRAARHHAVKSHGAKASPAAPSTTSRRHTDRSQRKIPAASRTALRDFTGLEVSFGQSPAVPARLALFLVVQPVNPRSAAGGKKPDPDRAARIAFHGISLRRNGGASRKHDRRDGAKDFRAPHGFTVVPPFATNHGGLC